MKSAVLEKEISRLAPKASIDKTDERVSEAREIVSKGAYTAAPVEEHATALSEISEQSDLAEREKQEAKAVLFAAPGSEVKIEPAPVIEPETVRDLVSERTIGGATVVERPEVVSAPSEAVARISDYVEIPRSPAKDLFAGVVYNANVGWDVAVPTARVEEIPVVEEPIAAEAVYEPVPEGYLDLENVPEVKSETGFWAHISLKMKLVLGAIAFAVVLAIVLICVNSGMISTMEGEVGELSRIRSERLAQEQSVEQQIRDVTSFENVSQFAEENGATLGE